MSQGLTCIRRLSPEVQALRTAVLGGTLPPARGRDVGAELRALEAEKAQLLRVLALRDEVAKLRVRAARAFAQVSKDPQVTLAVLVELVASRTGVSRAQIMGRKRPQAVADARHIVCHLARELTELTLEDIGEVFNRDHGTVLHSVQVVANRCDTDAAFAALVRELEAAGREALNDPSSANRP